MHRLPVQSSQITAIGYDPGARKLEVEFPGGALYEYENVDQATYDGFFARDADDKPISIGKYFATTIKANAQRFPYKKLRAKGEG